MKGMFAKALAGHDKDEIYLIIEEKGDCVFLADGKIKTIEHPKKKKKKHIQLIKKATACSLNVKEKIEKNAPVSNEEIKRAIKLFKKEKMEE